MKVQQLRFLLQWGLCLVVFNSCAPLYTPNVVNAPFHEEKGEVQVSGHAGTNGGDIQTAVSVTDNIGVMGNFSHANRKDDTTKGHHYHDFGELGIGYYNSFDGGTYDIYGGYGYGEVSSRSSILSETVFGSGTFSRYFLQSSIGMHSDYVQGGLSMRGAYVNFHEIGLEGNTNPEGRDNAFFLEPAFTFRAGYKYVFFSSQLGLSLRTTSGNNTDDPSDDVIFNHQPFMLSFGLSFHIGKMFK